MSALAIQTFGGELKEEILKNMNGNNWIDYSFRVLFIFILIAHIGYFFIVCKNLLVYWLWGMEAIEEKPIEKGEIEANEEDETKGLLDKKE